MAGQTFEVSLESVTLYLNGYTEATAVEAEKVEEGVYFGRAADGTLAVVEVYAPIRFTTEKNSMRVQTRMLREEELNEAMGTDRTPETMMDTAHRTAAESGTSYQQRRAGFRGEGNVRPEDSGERPNGSERGGMVVNPNSTVDSNADTMDANARDTANGSVGRHGVAQDHAAVSLNAEEDHADPEEIANPDRAGQAPSARAEEAAGDNETAKEQAERGQEEAQKKVDERSDALATSGDVLGNNSESARLAETNSKDEEKARKEESKAASDDNAETLSQDDANANSSSSKKGKNAKSSEDKA